MPRFSMDWGQKLPSDLPKEKKANGDEANAVVSILQLAPLYPGHVAPLNLNSPLQQIKQETGKEGSKKPVQETHRCGYTGDMQLYV